MSKVEERLAKLGHEVPDPGTPMFNYVGAVKTGNLVFVAGHGPRHEDGEYVYRGKVGQDVDVDTARKAAELVILNCLGSSSMRSATWIACRGSSSSSGW